MGFVWWRSAAVLLAVALVCGYSSPLPKYDDEWDGSDLVWDGPKDFRVKREPVWKYGLGHFGYQVGRERRAPEGGEEDEGSIAENGREDIDMNDPDWEGGDDEGDDDGDRRVKRGGVAEGRVRDDVDINDPDWEGGDDEGDDDGDRRVKRGGVAEGRVRDDVDINDPDYEEWGDDEDEDDRRVRRAPEDEHLHPSFAKSGGEDKNDYDDRGDDEGEDDRRVRREPRYYGYGYRGYGNRGYGYYGQ